MIFRFLRIILLISLIFCGPVIYGQQKNLIWYDQPATNWNEALPVGNGYIGAMIFGNSQAERLQLNESTIWGGGPNNNTDSTARTYLNPIRQLIAQKKFTEAQLLANEHLAQKGNGGMPYQLAGNLYIDFAGHDQVSDYARDLNIDKATASVHYTKNGVQYKREYFTSFTANVLMVRLTASKPGMISCHIDLKSPLMKSKTVDNGNLSLSGTGNNHENQEGKVKFNITGCVKKFGGNLAVDTSGVTIDKADTAVIYIAIATNFINYHDITADPVKRTQLILTKACQKDFDQLRTEHTSFYQQYYHRVKLDLGTSEAATLTTDVRIRNFANGNDPQLAELYFQFGRYLLISSSQPGSQPANLQGIWNGDLKGAWDSKYTVNINTEMNYWPSEVTQLSELSTPLFNMISDLSVTGKATARDMYGARGWALHHNTDIWRITGIVDGPFWGLWPTGNAWLCQHLWEHYLFTGDAAFLKQYYPIMKSAAQYFIDVLQPEAEHHWLVVSPSVSPEHEFINGKTQVSISAGTTMDNQLVYGLFNAVSSAAAILKTDRLFADSLKTYARRIPPMQIGKYGQLQEWLDDLDSPTDNHRHVSHLYGLFPGNQISPFRNPKLFAAAKTSLLYRGDVSTGWSMAWKINLWARLLEGNHAYKLITDQLSPVKKGSGGTYPNLFDAHPPFQIDGNFGCTSGIAEMLLQSHDGFIYVLPALPDAWKTGSVTGLMARGGFKVDIAWQDHKVTRLVIHAALGGNCRIRINQPLNSALLHQARGANKNTFYQTIAIAPLIISPVAKPLASTLPQNWLYDLSTKKGGDYILIGE